MLVGSGGGHQKKKKKKRLEFENKGEKFEAEATKGKKKEREIHPSIHPSIDKSIKRQARACLRDGNDDSRGRVEPHQQPPAVSQGYPTRAAVSVERAGTIFAGAADSPGHCGYRTDSRQVPLSEGCLLDAQRGGGRDYILSARVQGRVLVGVGK